MNKRERAQALADDELALDADKFFFARRPGRSHRVRRAFPAERELIALLPGATLLPGDDVFVAVVRKGESYTPRVLSRTTRVRDRSLGSRGASGFQARPAVRTARFRRNERARA